MLKATDQRVRGRRAGARGPSGERGYKPPRWRGQGPGPARAVLLAAGLCAALAACASPPTPYQPGDEHGYGYTQQQLETNRWRLGFRGNTRTDRQSVQDYLLYRAAELTVEQGGDHFVVEHQDTGTHQEYRTSGFHHHFHDHWVHDVALDTRTWRAIERFEAWAIIKVFPGPAAEDDVHAYDARDVLATLGPFVHPLPGA